MKLGTLTIKDSLNQALEEAKRYRDNMKNDPFQLKFKYDNILSTSKKLVELTESFNAMIEDKYPQLQLHIIKGVVQLVYFDGKNSIPIDFNEFYQQLEDHKDIDSYLKEKSKR